MDRPLAVITHLPALTPRRARLLVQAFSVLFFCLLAALTFRESETWLPLDLYFRLDPLAAATAMVAQRAFLPTLVLSIAALALALVFGRAWCGWLCPLGAVLDWVSPHGHGKVESRNSWRGLKYVILISTLVLALLGNLTFLIFDPITLINRTFAAALVPGLNVLLVAVERLLAPVEPLQPLFDSIEQNLRGNILPAQQPFVSLGLLLGLVFVLVITLNWVATRFWCRYLCPLGAVYALESRISWLRPRVNSACDRCAACVRACPTSAISISRNATTIDRAECVLCMDCVTDCPHSGIEFKFGGDSSTPQNSLDPSRRHLLLSAALGVGSFALFRSAPSARRDDAFLIRPPGGRENGLLDKCIRCGECSKVCPTSGLQTSLFESGLEGLWTPTLVPRLGYCDYSCNACGQICPTGAIPPLALEDKRKQVIGTAFIDQNRCIPWAMYRPCIVCQEMCPLPDKAVKLEQVDAVTPDGISVHLQRPRIQHDLCIGCGICEYQCPIIAPAAIRVYAPTSLPPLS